MNRWLAGLPVWVLVVGWIAVCASMAVLARVGLRRLLHADESGSARATAGPLMPALGAAFTLLAALTLAGEATQQRTAEDNVAAEAAAASRLAWAVTNTPAAAPAIHQELQDYLTATLGREWSTEREEGDPAVLADLAGLEQSVRAAAATPGLGSGQAGEMLTAMDGVSSARRQRLATAARDLQGLYVAVVALSGLALIANAAALTVAHSGRVAVLVSGLVVVVGLSLALLFAITAPFRGGFVVNRQPLDQIVTDLQGGVFQPGPR